MPGIIENRPSLNRSGGPATEPVTTAEAKKHLELIASDTTHDDAIDDFVTAAREQVENDTGYALITQTYTLSLRTFPPYYTLVSGSNEVVNRYETDSIMLNIRPLQSITSITYYDTSNAQQTLSTDVYGLDTVRRLIYLKYDQEWPSITEQHNGIVVTFTAGYGAASTVPRLFKQAILLQVAKWFEHRDMTEPHMYNNNDTYERIIKRLIRDSYP